MDVMDSGEYYLDGMAIHETREDDLTEVRNLKIGFIFQNYQLIDFSYDRFSLSHKENLRQTIND